MEESNGLKQVVLIKFYEVYREKTGACNQCPLIYPARTGFYQYHLMVQTYIGV